ncbi:DNA polymerase I [Ureibacillus sp. Re31]|uniref:DNA polymerase I n=1 Tax=Ureibacillus galli TaxID=2762222 RepID=A0ABR8XAA2_9BACL|nr:DNA polymerase I [Ureibacillus galli]
MNKWIQNVLLAFIMSCSMTALFSSTPYFWMKLNIFHIPIVFIVIFCLTVGIAEDVRNSFKKVFKFEKRKDKRPIWQVGVGMIFFFTQVGFVEVFGRYLMGFELGGMPLYFIFAFMNAFLLTVVYEEIFYPKQSKIQG